MSLYVNVPISTEVIESNSDCQIKGFYENGQLVIKIDTRFQNHHQRLRIGTKIQLHWGKESSFEVQELSAFLWPIRYRVITREGYYIDSNGNRIYFTTNANGIDARRHVSKVLMRAAMLLLVIAGMGYRRVAWLMEVLFHVSTSKSSLQRWVGEVASDLPSGDEIIQLLNQKQPINECHLDEIFPRGLNHCVLVIKDEHGRILATEPVEKRNEETVKPFLQRMKNLGLSFRAFYTDGCQAYFNAIRAVFGKKVAIQYDYFHIIQNAWKHLWKWAVAHRRDIKKRSENVTTPWYKKETLAVDLWENRYLLFKAERRMTDDEKERLQDIMTADHKVGNLRTFLSGVWHIFEDSQDENDAREALKKLKTLPTDSKKPVAFQKVIKFIGNHFDWMIAFLSHEGVRRNSLSETSMRTLRRLEIEPDGFRSEKGRDNFVRLYQAIKYLGWNVYKPPPILRNTTVG
jgi:transposase-like protein